MTHPIASVRKAWGQVFERLDPLLLDMSWRGEVLHAQGRVLVVAVLLLLATIRYSGTAESGVAQILLITAAATALTVSILLLIFVVRRRLRPWLTFFSSVLDVTMLSAVLYGVTVLGFPNVALNSRVLFSVYYVIILSTTLRFVPAVCLVVGATTVVEYGLIVWVASTHPMRDVGWYAEQYGRIIIVEQVYRLVLLAIGSGIATITVIRARKLLDSSARDGLTGLLNRRFLDDRLKTEVSRARTAHKPLCVALLDLDDFKSFNDRWGHPAGDEALRSLARILLSTFRASDVVTRYGGEEFAVVMPGAELAVARPRLEAALESIRMLEMDILGMESKTAAGDRLSASVGLVEFRPKDERTSGSGSMPSPEAVADEVIQAADRLLLEAKVNGKNRVVSGLARGD